MKENNLFLVNILNQLYEPYHSQVPFIEISNVKANIFVKFNILEFDCAFNNWQQKPKINQVSGGKL